jgi:putative sigma-54 modulation protein
LNPGELDRSVRSRSQQGPPYEWITGSEVVQVKISARHGHLSESNQAAIREKALKLLNLFERLTMIEITADLQKSEDDSKAKVEILVQAEHKHDFVARECHADVMVAVDMVLHKVQAQLRRYKEKIQDHRRTPSVGEVAGSPGEAASEE